TFLQAAMARSGSEPQREPTRTAAPKPISSPVRLGSRAHIAIAALLLAPALSGCILGTERPDLNLEIPAAYREAGHRAPDAHVPALDWWRGFRSSELTTLMDDAQIYNLDIAVAIAQIVQADAQVGVSGAPLLPSITGTGTAEQVHNSSSGISGAASSGISGVGGGSTFSQYSLGLTASYMIDFWGKNRDTLYVAEATATAARYTRDVVTL